MPKYLIKVESIWCFHVELHEVPQVIQLSHNHLLSHWTWTCQTQVSLSVDLPHTNLTFCGLATHKSYFLWTWPHTSLTFCGLATVKSHLFHDKPNKSCRWQGTFTFFSFFYFMAAQKDSIQTL